MNTSSQLTQQEIFEQSELVKKMTIEEVMKHRKELQDAIMRLNHKVAIISNVINGIEYTPTGISNTRQTNVNPWDTSVAFIGNMKHIQNALFNQSPQGFNQSPLPSNLFIEHVSG